MLRIPSFKYFKVLLGLFFTVVVSTSLLAKPLTREIVALWDSQQLDAREYTETDLHQSLEVVINHFGLKLVYFDISNEDDIQKIQSLKLENYLGLVSWFNGEKGSQPKVYLSTLRKFSENKKPILLMGRLGLFDHFEKKQYLKSLNEIAKSWGLQFDSLLIDNPLFFNISKKKNAEFERSLEKEIFYARKVHNLKPQNDVWLSLQVKNFKNPFDTIVVGEWGAYVQAGFEIFTHPKNYLAQWRVDPFKLVKKVFYDRLGNFPIPDVTTVCGKRSLFIHIDGDGFINVSNTDRKTLSGEVIYNQVIKKHRLPTTASIVVAEIEPKIVGFSTAKNISKRMFKDSLIEPASHTFSHPLSWNLEPTEEEKKIYLSDEKISTHKGPIVAYKIKDYSLNYSKEIQGSVDYINSELTTRDNKTDLLLWSGSCMPPQNAMKELKDLLNMNGGDSRFDRIFNSYNNLSALYREVGPYTQVYAAAANENNYTNLWTGPFNGFRHLIETFEKTENPVRIKPMNIYYHFYSGEHQSSLDALDEVYGHVLKQEITPIFASEYIKSVLDFRELSIEEISPTHFQVLSEGNLRTLRLPRTDLYPDYTKSKNILGHRAEKGQMYIHLGDARETQLHLTDKVPRSPYVSSCNGFLDDLRVLDDKILLRGTAHQPFSLKLIAGEKERVINVESTGSFEKEVTLNVSP